MAAITRLGLHGGPRGLYGDFSGKAAAAVQMSGSTGWATAPTGDLFVGAALAGSTGWDTAPTGSLNVEALLAGSTGFTWTPSGNLTELSDVAAAIVGISGLLEQEIREGWESFNIVLTGATWDSGQDFNDARQSIVDGVLSAQNELRGFNNQVSILLTDVVRVTDEIVSIRLPVSQAYQVAANETLTVTVPASANSDATAIIATPTIGITADADTGIVNADADDTEPTNYEICDRTGFRELPHTLQREWTGNYIRADSFERRHSQDFVRSKTDKLPGSVAPEGDDTFIPTLFPGGVDADSDL